MKLFLIADDNIVLLFRYHPVSLFFLHFSPFIFFFLLSTFFNFILLSAENAVCIGQLLHDTASFTLVKRSFTISIMIEAEGTTATLIISFTCSSLLT